MSEMAKLWAELVQNGIKTIDQVPKKLLEKVQTIINDSDNEE